MTIRPITIHGEPVLHRRADEVRHIDEQVLQILEDMDDTLEAANGVGLAAPQIGVGLRIFNWAYDGDTGSAERSGVVINPRLRLIGRVSRENPDPEDEVEGCLSVPGHVFPLKRSDHVEVRGLDAGGRRISFEATGWFARVLQHEYDHLDGRLYVDRLGPRWAKRWKKTLKREGWTVPGNTWVPGLDPDPFGHDPEDPQAPGSPQAGTPQRPAETS